MTMNWSQPMPVRRSAMAAARAGVRPSAPRALVEHDEVVAAAVHLEEGGNHGGVIWGARQPAKRPGGLPNAAQRLAHGLGQIAGAHGAPGRSVDRRERGIFCAGWSGRRCRSRRSSL